MKIEELIKGGQLIEIEVDKVSLVKSPANRRRFIFTKSAGTGLTVNDDGTFWDGEKLDGCEAVNFSFSGDGVEVTFKGVPLEKDDTEMGKSELLKAMKDNLGIELDEATFDKMPIEKQKALTSLAVYSPALNGQPAFREGIALFVKAAIEPEEAPPAEPPETPPETPPADDEAEARLKAMEEELAALKTALADKGSETTEPEPAVVAKAIKNIQKQVTAIAKAAGVKESSETDIEKDGKVEDLWPSIKLE